jgi:hypothetical protein
LFNTFVIFCATINACPLYDPPVLIILIYTQSDAKPEIVWETLARINLTPNARASIVTCRELTGDLEGVAAVPLVVNF